MSGRYRRVSGSEFSYMHSELRLKFYETTPLDRWTINGPQIFVLEAAVEEHSDLVAIYQFAADVYGLGREHMNRVCDQLDAMPLAVQACLVGPDWRGDLTKLCEQIAADIPTED